MLLGIQVPKRKMKYASTCIKLKYRLVFVTHSSLRKRQLLSQRRRVIDIECRLSFYKGCDSDESQLRRLKAFRRSNWNQLSSVWILGGGRCYEINQNQTKRICGTAMRRNGRYWRL